MSDYPRYAPRAQFFTIPSMPLVQPCQLISYAATHDQLMDARLFAQTGSFTNGHYRYLGMLGHSSTLQDVETKDIYLVLPGTGAADYVNVTHFMAAPTPPPYNSRPDTLAHIARVDALLNECSVNLLARGDVHDLSKLEEPEKSGFDTCHAKLSGIVYGTPEYTAALAELKPTLDHHYAHNRHHPEWHQSSVDGMTLFDVMEMLMDWKAATERMKNGTGDIRRSLKVNTERFKLSPQLAAILANTIEEMKW